MICSSVFQLAKPHFWFRRNLTSILVLSCLLPAIFGFSIRAADFVLSEFMAANNSGEKDEDGEFSDWIEIYNPDKISRSLEGWTLSDDPKDLAKWKLPALLVPSRSFVLVFASGKNRLDPKRNLHTNFKLKAEGGYLGLTRPDGTKANEYLSYPRQLSNVSYGVSMSTNSEIFVGADTVGRFLVPNDGLINQTWMQPAFDDSAWTQGTSGLGYDRILPGQNDPAEPVIPTGDVTSPTDVIVPTSLNSPGNEGVANAIDNTSVTKYLNFDKLNAGFTVTLSKGPAVVTGLRLTSANDAPERDPTSFILTGSTDGQLFIEVARGSIPSFSGRFTTVQVTFNNSVAYKQYRLLFPTVSNAAAAVAMQISEIEFMGKTGPETGPISDWVKTNVESMMFGDRRTSLYFRLPFVVRENPSWEDLALVMRYDDGFAAWINGTPVARANAPVNSAFDSVSLTNRLRRDAAQAVRFDLAPFLNAIHPGTNLLAVQGWNDRADSPDFLLEARIENSRNVIGEMGYFDMATPRGINATGRLGLVSDPILNQPHGFRETPFDLVMTCETEDATIRYTTNGSAPSATNGFLYSIPVRIDHTTVIRAAAFKEAWRTSRTITRTYLFANDVIRQDRTKTLAAGLPASWGSQTADYGLDPRIVGPADSFGGKYAKTIAKDLQSLPSMSITMSTGDMFGAQGIYANPLSHGEAWERAGSIELIYPDGRPGFQEDAGFRIQGGAFRGFNLTLKKSFRVIFRDKYGNSVLRFPLFGPDAAPEFNNFVLRANSNDAWPYGGGSALYIRDSFAMESARAMGIVSSHSTFVHLYINGFYWGMYNPAERPDAAFSASYHGGDKSTWDAINQDSVPDGNYDAWNRMLAMLSQDFTKTDVYQRIQGNNPDGTRNPAFENLLDVDNMIDYLIMNFYIGNADWPGRNWWTSRDRNNGDGFKFHPWDSETALGFTAVTADVTGANAAVARPWAALRVNADFRLRFADHVFRHFFNGGTFAVNPSASAWNPAKPENNRPAARLFALAEQIKSGIVGETARWGDQLRSTPYTRDENWQKALDSLLLSYFPARSANVLQQFRNSGLYPKIDPPMMNASGGLVQPGFQLTLSAPRGVIYYTMDGTDPKTSATARTYTNAIPLVDIVQIKSRLRDGTEWSALNQAKFIAGTPRLTVSELHYHPAKPDLSESTAGYTNADDFEFLELWNNGTASYELTGVHFETGIQFDFATSPIQRLAPGNYLLLVKNRLAFEKRYGTGLTIAGEYAGKLDNSGERLQAFDAKNNPVLDWTYGVQAPWPLAADGGGPSLEVIDPAGDLTAASNWRPSFRDGGSPGKANPADGVRVEILQTNATTLRIAFQGLKGLGYSLYASDDIRVPVWTLVQGGAPLPADSRIELTLPLAGSHAKFFRISVP